jgi:peptidoglycan/LPS O-acetylase OafA/YrhL
MVGTSADIMLDRPVKPGQKPLKSLGFRRDIQGLRAIAVGVVVLDHAIAWPSGGFVGVDIFFVLSGFLITSLLLREHDRTGGISIADFYRRRMRRILPVSYVVLGVTLLVAAIVFTTARFLSTVDDAIWTMFFAINWHLAINGTDYMQASAAESPLQHYWSLAVEEQFYLVWPLVMIGVFALTRSIARRRGVTSSRVTRRWVFGVLLGLSVLSLAWSLFESIASPTFAYFSTFSRAWELGVGALIALAGAKLKRLTSTSRTVLAYAGLAGIVVSLFVITPTSTFPAPWALLPVLATALVLVSGVGLEARRIGVLTNPVSRYLGDISYSLYLWHWPVIIFIGMFLPMDNPFVVLLVIGLAVALAAFTYHFLENPVRESSWLEPRARRASRKAKKPAMTRRTLGRGWIGAIAVVAVALITMATLSNGVVRVPDPTIIVSAPVEDAAGFETAAELRTAEIATALSATAWPALDPAIETMDKNAGAQEWVVDGCLNIYPNDPDKCIYGDAAAPKLAVVLGDSTAISYMPGLRPALEEQGYRIQMLTMFSCPAWDISVGASGSEPTRVCNVQHDWVYDYVKELQPDLIIMSSLAGNVVKLTSGTNDAGAVQEYGEAAATTLADLTPAAKEGVIVISPPPGKDEPLAECKTPQSVPADCMTEVSSLFQTVAVAEQRAVATAGEKVRYVDTIPWICNRNTCPSFVGTSPVMWDGIHLTDNASAALQPLWTETLFPEAAATEEEATDTAQDG